MAKLVTKHVRVLSKSLINNNVEEAGSIVTIQADPNTWQPGPNLVEVPDHKPLHTEAQKKEADEESKLTKERLDKQASREKADEKADKPAAVAVGPSRQRLTFPSNPFAVGAKLSQSVAPGEAAEGTVEAVNGPIADVKLSGLVHFQVSGQPVNDTDGHSAAATGVAPL
jgi:hypothetical protein